MNLERENEVFTIDALLLSELLNIPSSDVQTLMRCKEITSVCERGQGEHEGEFRLTFFYKGRRARLSVDQAGWIVRRSTINLGERPGPAAMRQLWTS